MTTVNLILQGKGGVGKSVIAALTAQYLQEKGINPICIDTDPINATFAGYAALKVEPLEILNEDQELNIRAFDVLIEKIVSADSQPLVVDNGASSFIPLMNYIIQNDIPAFLDGLGHKIVVHSVITGGQAFLDTLSGFTQTAEQFPVPASFVVWENPFWGAVQTVDGVPLEKTKAFAKVQDRIELLVKLPKLKAELSGKDFSNLLKVRQTFPEAIQNNDVSVIVRHRLKQVRDAIFRQLDQAAILLPEPQQSPKKKNVNNEQV